MNTLLKHHPLWQYAIPGVFILVLCAGSVYAWREHTRRITAQTDLKTAQKSVSELQEKLGVAEEDRERVQGLLLEASEENAAFGKRVEALASSVNFLDKLSKTDRELLQKYSSVYFLSENFIPDPLVPLDSELLARRDASAMLHGDVSPFLKNMMHMAKADGAALLVLSAYRSFGEQGAVKTGYKVSYGGGTANKFSADQGYSEHQLGSTVDFSTPESPLSLKTSFSTTPQYQWLMQNAHTYGFVLSYPKGNTYFQFEPWHWRFVGVDLATRLYSEGKSFYDLDQREINAYLARIFD